MTQRQVVGHELGEYVRDLVPQELVPVFVAVTHLGNAGLFLAIFALDYWFGDRSRGAHALGVAVGGMGLVVALKSFFAQPRPPDAVAAIAISGYAFPSGHAMQSTIGYGILAHDLDVGTERQRYAVAGVLVSLVALSRVVIGVHYVRDVVAGVVVASLFLAGTIRLTNHVPGTAFLLAAALGTAAVGISGASHHGLAVFGASLGAVVAWRYLVGDETLESRADRLVLVLGVLPVLAGLGYAAVELRPPPVVVVSLTAALTAGILLAPRVVDRVTHAAGLAG